MKSRISVLAACVGLSLAASLAWGQAPVEKKGQGSGRVTTDKGQPSEKKPAAGQGESKRDAAKAEFPKIVKKNLFAQKDLRGKKAMTQEFGTWLNTKPEMKDKVVLIDFWATWCGPCRRLMPELGGWQAKFKDDLVVIGISDEKVSVVKDFFKKASMEYSMAVDTKGTMKKELGVSGIPHVLIIGADGIVRWQGFPGDASDRLTESVLKQIIDADKARRAAASGTQAPSKDKAHGTDTKGTKATDSSSGKAKETTKDSQSESHKDSGTATKGGGR